MLIEKDSAAQPQINPNVIVVGERDGSLGLNAGSDPLYLKVVSQLPLPGIVIFVHGVNSDGEWFHAAEEGLCAGLNTRLARKDDQLAYPTVEGGKLTPVNYMRDLTPDGYLNPQKTPKRFIQDEPHFSPVIQFRWGYKASAADMQTYGDALFLNERNYWGGGPFANGCSSIPDLWEGGLNDQLFLWLHAQHLNPAHDRMVYACPHRGYYVVAALRLAKLIGEIRKKQADVPVTIVCHSQGNMVSIAAAFLGDKLGRVTDATGKPGNCVANTYVLCNPPYSLLKSNLVEGWTQLGTGRQTYEARIGTLENFFEIMRQQAKDHAKPQSVDDIDQFIANEKHGFSAQADRGKHGFEPSAEKSNYGRVTLYFNPHDQVISASPVQGIGWRGMSADEIRDARGAGVFCQRVFAQGFAVGGEKKYYDFWADHHVQDKNKHPLKAGSKQFWYPESLRAQYSVKKGTDANDNMLPKIMTVATAPVFYLFFKTIDVRINGMPDKDWKTPLDAPPLDPPFTPQSMRFGNKSDAFDEGVDAPGSSRNAGRAREADDPYAGDRPLSAASKHSKQSLETDEAKGNEDTEASLMYEHHAMLRMQAKREGLHKNSDANQKTYGKADSVTEEDDLKTASEGYKTWRAEKIKMILADTVGTPATDHSTILTNPDHSEKALAYDIPVGVCHIPKEDLANLRKMADWRYLKNLDENHPIATFNEYFKSGLMGGKEVAEWVGKEGDSEAMLPPKVINKRSLI